MGRAQLAVAGAVVHYLGASVIMGHAGLCLMSPPLCVRGEAGEGMTEVS